MAFVSEDLHSIQEEPHSSNHTNSSSQRTVTVAQLAATQKEDRAPGRKDQLQRDMAMTKAVCGSLDKHASVGGPMHHQSSQYEMKPNPTFEKHTSMFHRGLSMHPMHPLPMQLAPQVSASGVISVRAWFPKLVGQSEWKHGKAQCERTTKEAE